MKKIVIIAASLLALASCKSLKEEFQPVFTGSYAEPSVYKFYTDADFANIITISQLAQQYSTGKPFEMPGDNDLLKGAVIKGRVSSTDKPGNFYKSFYIQDETAGMEIKIGKNGLYNDYLEGQIVYVKLDGLTLGMYGYKSGNYGGMGMVQVGFSDPSGEYETSYMEVPFLIEKHILRGDPSDIVKVDPIELTESMLPNAKSQCQKNNQYVGKLVALKGLKYANETFVLLYLDSNKDKKSGTNRVFLSDSNGIDPCGATHGITTWAMSKSKMSELLLKGIWDKAEVASGSVYLLDADGKHVTVGHKLIKGDGDYPGIERAAYSVSQYFKMGSTEIQIRTSGYCKFCDKEIPAEVLSGAKTIDVTGVLSVYQGSLQFTVNNISDFVVDGKPLE